MFQINRFASKLRLSQTLARSLSVTNQLNRNIKPNTDDKIPMKYDDPFLDLHTNKLVHGLRHEFNYLRNQINKRFNLLNHNVTEDFFMPMSAERNIYPIYTDKEGNRHFKFSLNLPEFKPEEIKVKTVGKNLVVSAKTEIKTEKDYYLKEFSQSYQLPNDINLADLKSKLTNDGQLIVEALLPKLAEVKSIEEKTIEIKHEKLTQFNQNDF